VGVGLLAASTAYSAYDRYFNQGQSGWQALLGGAADATGISGIYTGITGRDLVTQHHLSLTPAQQRQILTEGSIQAVGSALVLYGGLRSFLRGRVPVAPATPRLGTLRSTGSNAWESSGGLRYVGRDPAGLNRVQHVLRHAEDIPGRPGPYPHGVFDAGRSGTLAVVDEAWAIAQRGGPGVTAVQQGGRTVYTIDMGRRVGYVGGQVGRAAGNPGPTTSNLSLKTEIR